jgi:NAD(P)-dependent dehydrogenase (short-subunit alcohol dehydrogenase family)
MEIRNRIAVVTGAAVGSGRAIAVALAEAGAEVVVADIDAAGGADTVRLAPAGRARFMHVDMTSREDVLDLIRRTEPQILVNNSVHVITLYLRCVTPGASTARTCSSSISAPPRFSKRRAPSPSSTGTMWSSSSSRSPAARDC